MSKPGTEMSKEYDYLKVQAPPTTEPTLVEKLRKEWKARWWLWSVVLFAVVVCGGLLVFRGSLYTQNVGMPYLAVTENAQELCDSKCADDVGLDDEGKPTNKDKYEACLATCVKGETESVAEERQEFAEEQKEAEDETIKEADPKSADAAAKKEADEEAKLDAAAEAEAGVRKMMRKLR